MAALLGRLIAAQRSGQAAAGVPLGCLARLQRAFDAQHACGTPGRVPPRRCQASVEPLTAPRAGGAVDAGGGQVEPGHRRAVGGHPRHRQKARHATSWSKLGAANRTEAVARARELGLIP